MDYSQVLKQAKERCSICKVCLHCNGVVCAGWIPGIGGKGTGASFKRNYASLRNYALKMDTIAEDVEVDTSTSLFGRKVSMPIYAAPLGDVGKHYGCDISDDDYIRYLFEGCSKANTIAFSGDGRDLNIFLGPLSILNEYDNGICTIKPWQYDAMKERLDAAEKSSTLAIACDIDAAGLPFLRGGFPAVEFKSEAKLKELCEMTSKPVILKGIMSLEGARKAYEAGAKGIVVSNHGGRVLDDCAAAIDVLEEIADAYKDKMVILVDGGFRSGSDVFKALALGAHGVLIGRPAALCAIGGEAEGVFLYFEKIRNELEDCMKMCGCKTVADIMKKHIYK